MSGGPTRQDGTPMHVRRADVLAQLADALERVLCTVNDGYTYRPEPGYRDTWLTPDEMRAAGGGDCEDFAIAYWQAIRAARLPGEPRLARLSTATPHMVCLHYGPDSGDPWVLDVLAAVVYPLSDRLDDARVVFELGADARGRARCWVSGQSVAVPSAWAGVLARLGGAA